MYAIVEFAGQQVKVEPDVFVEVPKLAGNVGDPIVTEKVLMSENNSEVKIGNPYIDSAKVSATIYAHDRTKKSLARIYKRRKQYKKTWGFRRDFTILKINTINI